AEGDDARLEGMVLYLTRHEQKGVRQVDRHAANGHFGGDAVLVGVGAEYVSIVRLTHRLENPYTGSIGVLETDVDATRELRHRLILAAAYVIPVSDVAGDDARTWVYSVRPSPRRGSS